MNDVFLGKHPADGKIKWKEDHIQMYVVQQARREGYLVTASMEQGKRGFKTAARAKAMGMTAGVPDLTFWRRKRNTYIELKTAKGKLSDRQKEFHAEALKRGVEIQTVYADCPMDGWNKVQCILEKE